ncbi:Mannose-1-phosphate guanyltransferase [Candidatus Sulfopaludibacter sp. SbA6]|nr:Mannose-1-phosphate guanyltransferase [Candidatus Sulfopaludibacter sp. SbA6]
MKALILAAGKGTRVQPLTRSIPKPMLPILNKPVMETLIDLLRDHGVTQIVINTSYLATEIESYFRDGERFGVEIAYSFEGSLREGRLHDEPLGSAGSIRRIQDHSGFFDETFFVLCGDALIDLDLTRMAEEHRRRGAIASIALAEVDRQEVSSYGVVVTDAEGWIRDFQEKPSVEAARSNLVNTGIYLFEPAVVDRIPRTFPYDLGSQVFPALVADKQPFLGVHIPFEWLDIGKTADYYKVLQHALRGGIPHLQPHGREIAPGVRVGPNTRLDLTQTTVVPPVVIGGSCRIDPGVRIVGPTLIDAGCTIESGAEVVRSLVFPYTRVGAHAHLTDTMACGRYCVKSDGTVLEIDASDLGWVLSDSREPLAEAPEHVRELLDLMAVLEKPRG